MRMGRLFSENSRRKILKTLLLSSCNQENNFAALFKVILVSTYVQILAIVNCHVHDF